MKTNKNEILRGQLCINFEFLATVQFATFWIEVYNNRRAEKKCQDSERSLMLVQLVGMPLNHSIWK